MSLTRLRHRATRNHPDLYARLRQARGRLNARRHGLTDPGVGSSVSASAHMHPGTRLGDYAYVGPGCHIAVPVTIGRYSMLAPRVAVVGADHVFTEPGTPTIFAGRPAEVETVIGSDVWLGYGVIVLAGVTIGDATVVGAGSVVTRDLPPASICAGNPARVIRPRFATDAEAAHHLEQLQLPTRRGAFADPR